MRVSETPDACICFNFPVLTELAFVMLREQRAFPCEAHHNYAEFNLSLKWPVRGDLDWEPKFLLEDGLQEPVVCAKKVLEQ